MATIITVHGTFATPTVPDSNGALTSEPQWWEAPSTFERDLRELVQSRDGKLEFKPFIWSGDNSEVERREAGAKLCTLMRELESKNEPYCVIGHSHGGSVIASALLQCAFRRKALPNLKRWITVGTPFLNLRKERVLLTRLSLVRKVIFVASMMLLLMLLVYQAATAVNGDRMLFGRYFPSIFYWTAAAMSAPAVIAYLLFGYLDYRSLLNFHRRATKRAREYFRPRWLALSHPDDEAIQGLALLPDATLSFFDRAFAVPTITLISVVALPLLYFAALLSPPTIVAVSSWIYEHVYAENSSPVVEAEIKALRDELIAARKKEAEEQAAAESGQIVRDGVSAWRAYRAKREALQEKYPDLPAIERQMRFKQRFFEQNGKPCEGGVICGAGRDLTYNSGLLLHLVTDELSWALGAQDLRGAGLQGILWSLAIPLVVVPLIFGLVALFLMVTIHGIATVISRVSSVFLNRITNAEVKRAGFGNDTDGEFVTGASDRPMWLERSQPRLPDAIADGITDYSNAAATQAIAKFRHAIGRIRFAVPPHTADTAISTYFTWKELVHASYFDVPEFRKLVAQAIGRTEGFAASVRFKADPDFERTAEWLDYIEGSPGTTEVPSDRGPGPAGAKAVAAVLSSTVKAEP